MQKDFPSIYKSAECFANVVNAYDRVLELWPVQYQSLMVPTRFGDTHIITGGSESYPPLIVLHGGGNCALMWGYVMEEFCRHYRVFAPDAPGDIGKSFPAKGFTDPPGYSEWLIDMMDHLGIAKPHLAGISYGGGVALSASLYSGERFDKIVALCPAWGLAMFRVAALLYHSLPAVFFPSTKRLYKLLGWLSAKENAFRDPFGVRLVEYLAVAYKHYRQPKSPKPAVFTDDELKKINNPVLLLVGEKEVIFSDPQAVIERAKKFIPCITAGIIPDAGHTLIYDQPGIVNRMMMDFLKK